MAEISGVVSGIIENQSKIITKVNSQNVVINILSGMIDSVSGNVLGFENNFYDKTNINSLLNNKANIVVGDLPSSGELNTLYIDNSGKVAVNIGNELTEISLEAVDSLSLFKNNSSVVPTAKAVADYVDGLISNQTAKQVSETLSSSVIQLKNECSIYSASLTGDINFTFDESLLTDDTYTFELWVDMPSAYIITFPIGSKWVDGSAPSMSASGLYCFTVRKMPSTIAGKVVEYPKYLINLAYSIDDIEYDEE